MSPTLPESVPCAAMDSYARMPQSEGMQPEWEIDPASLRLGKKVGEGEFGAVYKATWFGATVAVKVLRRSDAVALGDFRTELNVMQKVRLWLYKPALLAAFTSLPPREP